MSRAARSTSPVTARRTCAAVRVPSRYFMATLLGRVRTKMLATGLPAVLETMN